MTGVTTDFSVMSFNLRFGLAGDGDNAWNNRSRLVTDVFDCHPPTFIGVQESNHFQTRFLIDHLKGYKYIGWHNPENKRWQSNLIFYDAAWKCIQHRHCFLSETPDVESKIEGSKWPRQFVAGLFEKDGQRIIAANMHFDFDAKVQEKSARLACRFLADFPDECPVALTGDFNSNPGSPAWEFFRESGFKDAFEGKHATTFHGFEGKKTGRHIDWILYRGLLKNADAKIITDNDGGCYPSDHYPVMAWFSF